MLCTAQPKISTHRTIAGFAPLFTFLEKLYLGVNDMVIVDTPCCIPGEVIVDWLYVT